MCPGRGRGRSPGASPAPPASRHLYEHAPVALSAAARPPVVSPWPLPAVSGSGLQGSTNPAGPAPPAAARSSKPMPAHGLMQAAHVPLAAAAAARGGAQPAERSAHGCVPAEGPAVLPGTPAGPAPMTAGPPAPLATAHAEAPASHAATHAEQAPASGLPAPIVLPAPACGPLSMGSSAPPVALPVPGALAAGAAFAGSAAEIAPLAADLPPRAAPLPQQARFAPPVPAPAFLRLPDAPAPVSDPSPNPDVTPAVIPAGASGLPGPFGAVPGAPNQLCISPGLPAVQQGAVPQRFEPLAGAPVPIAAAWLDKGAVDIPPLALGPAGAGSQGWLPASAYAAAPQPQGLLPGPGASLGGLDGAPPLQVGFVPTGASGGDVPAMGFLPPGAIAPVAPPLVPDQAAQNLAALPVPRVLPAPPGHAALDPAALPAPPVLPAPDLATWACPATAPPVLPRPLDLPMGKKAQRRAAAAARRRAAAAGDTRSADASPQGWPSPSSAPPGPAMGPSRGWEPSMLRAAGPGHAAGGPAGRGFTTLATAGASRVQAAGPPGAGAAAQERSWEEWLGGDALAEAAGPAMHSGAQTAAEPGGPDAKRRRTAHGAARTPGMRRS